MNLEEKDRELEQIIGHRLVSLVMFTAKHSAAEVLDRVNEEIKYIKTAAKSYYHFSAKPAPGGPEED